jgi:methionine sulfoxide reductase heme-binding subunit
MPAWTCANISERSGELKAVLTSRWSKAVVFVVCLVPLGKLIWAALDDGLGANPIEFITHKTGDWTLIFLVLTLSVTPARKLLEWAELIRFRRMLGLFAFFYGFLHFSTWIGLDQFFNLAAMLHDVRKRPFITAGFTAFVLMAPLAITSTAGWIRRLGGKRWRALHRLVYISAVAGVIHYYWLVKSDVRKPLFYGMLVAVLLLLRIGFWLRLRPRATRSADLQVGTPESSPTSAPERKRQTVAAGVSRAGNSQDRLRTGTPWRTQQECQHAGDRYCVEASPTAVAPLPQRGRASC